MSKKRLKLIVDTSAVSAALGSSSPAHCQHFQERVAGADLWGTVYIRMEFIRRWFCDYAAMAFIFAQCTTLQEGLRILSQTFSPRKAKSYLVGMASLLEEKGVLENPSAAAEEMASTAVAMLDKFDHVFKAKTNNSCKCQVGGMSPEVDFNRLIESVRVFYETFKRPITDCEVNAFLQMNNADGRAMRLSHDPKLQKLAVVRNLAKMHSDKTWITCAECAKVGDAIIALEQPKSWSLAHVDASFDEFCRVLDRQHVKIKSVLRVEKEAGKNLTGVV